MKTLANILWFIFGGFISAILYFLVGCLLYLTIIGIPFANQLFKMAKLVLKPFGTNVKLNFAKHPIANTIWVIFFGWEFAIGHLISALLFFVTIIGIPFGLQWVKFAKLALFPFGARVK